MVLLSPRPSWGQDEPPDLDPRYHWYYLTESGPNIMERSHEKLDTTRLPVYLFPTRVEELTKYQSSAVTPSSFPYRILHQDEANGVDTKVLLPMIDTPQTNMKYFYWKIRSHHASSLVAQRVHSQFSFLVWDSSQPGAIPFQIKWIRYNDKTDEDQERSWTNGSSRSTQSMASMDYLRDWMDRDPSKSELPFSFLPESFGYSTAVTTPSIPGFSTLISRLPFNFWVRELVPYGMKELGAHQRLVAAHGFFGSNLVEKVARLAGLSVQEWIQRQYLPKLAETLAILHYRYGLSTALHTQNLLMVIDSNNGNLDKVVIRDLQDISIRLTSRQIKSGEVNWHLYHRALQARMPVATLEPSDPSEPESIHPWEIFARYAGQSVYWITNRDDHIKDFTLRFLKWYLHFSATEIPTQIDSEPFRRSLENFQSLRNWTWHTSRNVMAEVDRALYSIASNPPPVLGGWKAFAPEVLHKIVRRKWIGKQNRMIILNNQVLNTLLQQEEELGVSHITYAYDGRFLYTLRYQDWMPLAVSYGLSAREHAYLRRHQVQVLDPKGLLSDQETKLVDADLLRTKLGAKRLFRLSVQLADLRPQEDNNGPVILLLKSGTLYLVSQKDDSPILLGASKPLKKPFRLQVESCSSTWKGSLSELLSSH